MLISVLYPAQHSIEKKRYYVEYWNRRKIDFQSWFIVNISDVPGPYHVKQNTHKVECLQKQVILARTFNYNMADLLMQLSPNTNLFRNLSIIIFEILLKIWFPPNQLYCWGNRNPFCFLVFTSYVSSINMVKTQSEPSLCIQYFMEIHLKACFTAFRAILLWQD